MSQAQGPGKWPGRQLGEVVSWQRLGRERLQARGNSIYGLGQRSRRLQQANQVRALHRP